MFYFKINRNFCLVYYKNMKKYIFDLEEIKYNIRMLEIKKKLVV